MSWFESFILGLVQGLTEFLPISSSAHLRLTAAFSGWKDPGAAFTAITQIGTEAAVLIYFRKDIGRIISAWSRSLFNKDAAQRPRRPDGLAGDRRLDPDRCARRHAQGRRSRARSAICG